MGIHPYQMEKYTPGELRALLLYAEAKREQLKGG